MAPSGNGDCGNGLWVAIPLPALKVALVGVVASSIIGCAGAGRDCGAVFGRGVVGDITFASSFCCASCGSGEDMLGLLTDRKADIVCLICRQR